jgi:hypothetical protein
MIIEILKIINKLFLNFVVFMLYGIMKCVFHDFNFEIFRFEF